MTAKLLIIFGCAALGTLTGFIVMKSFGRDLAYITELCALVDALKRNISYRSDSAADILTSFAATASSAHLKKNVAEYVAFASSKGGELAVSRGFLPKDVYLSASGFFASLGGADRRGQLDALDAYGKDFEKLKAKAEERSTKYGALSVKLGFLFGLGVGVLFL